jgi:hypothetical protein
MVPHAAQEKKPLAYQEQKNANCVQKVSKNVYVSTSRVKKQRGGGRAFSLFIADIWQLVNSTT